MASDAQEALELVISDFEAASTGPDVKQTLLMVLIMLNSMSSDVKTLNKKPIGEYLLKTQYDKFVSEVDVLLAGFTRKISKDSGSAAALLKRGDAYNELYPLLNRLKSVIGNTKGEWAESKDPDRKITDLRSALNSLANTIWGDGKEPQIDDPSSTIVKAITEKGGTVESSDNVLDLANRISNMANGDILIKPLTVTSRVATYPEVDHQAYGPVTVDITASAKERVITSNGTWDCSSDTGYEGGYSKVIVNVPGGSGSGSGSSGSGSSSSGSGSDEEESGDGSELKLTEYTAVENGPVNASDYDCDGFDKVWVNVEGYAIDPDKRFTVKFVVNSDVVEEVTDVEPFSTVKYSGPTPEHEYTGDLWYFTGWDPVPYDVIHDMTCVAQFSMGIPDASNPPTKFPGALLSDSWEEICADAGAHYAIGACKLLCIEGIEPVIMQKVNGSLESNATSVWLARTLIDLEAVCTGMSSGEHYFSKIDDSEPFDWNNCVTRRELNSSFFNRFPQVLKDRIVQMAKYHVRPGNDYEQESNVYLGVSEDKIWIPGMHEMNIIDINMDLPFYDQSIKWHYTKDTGNTQQAYNSTRKYFYPTPRSYQNDAGQTSVKGRVSKSLLAWISELGDKNIRTDRSYKVRALLPHVQDMEWEPGRDHWDALPYSTKKQIMENSQYGEYGEPYFDMKYLLFDNNDHIPFYNRFKGFPISQFGDPYAGHLIPLRDFAGYRNGSSAAGFLFGVNSSIALYRDPLGYVEEGSGIGNSWSPVLFGFGLR